MLIKEDGVFFSMRAYTYMKRPWRFREDHDFSGPKMVTSILGSLDVQFHREIWYYDIGRLYG